MHIKPHILTHKKTPADRPIQHLHAVLLLTISILSVTVTVSYCLLLSFIIYLENHQTSPNHSRVITIFLCFRPSPNGGRGFPRWPSSKSTVRPWFLLPKCFHLVKSWCNFRDVQARTVKNIEKLEGNHKSTTGLGVFFGQTPGNSTRSHDAGWCWMVIFSQSCFQKWGYPQSSSIVSLDFPM